LVTDLVLKLDKSNNSIELHPENIPLISVVNSVLKLDKLNEIIEIHPENI
jgi:hypothetical protein